ncbi:hypothetical protein QVD17_16062 [Tagetes erecta]|uniref:Uncharacterized protein n=1 Tax=Tagetes erecta TaxID=13708 RepID=A0AAD8KQ94_TARER|nr:hypothetical protein QVD17_16062 [Tagetes erecta]
MDIARSTSYPAKTTTRTATSSTTTSQQHQPPLVTMNEISLFVKSVSLTLSINQFISISLKLVFMRRVLQQLARTPTPSFLTTAAGKLRNKKVNRETEVKDHVRDSGDGGDRNTAAGEVKKFTLTTRTSKFEGYGLEDVSKMLRSINQDQGPDFGSLSHQEALVRHQITP